MARDRIALEDADWIALCHAFDRHVHTLAGMHRDGVAPEAMRAERHALHNSIVALKTRLPRVINTMRPDGDAVDTIHIFAGRYLREARAIERLLAAHDPRGEGRPDDMRALCSDLHELYG